MIASVNQGHVRGLNSLDELQSLVTFLGFDADPAPHDLTEEMPQARQALIARHGGRRSRGYGVLLAELDTQPRSFQPVGRHLLESVHDRPLAFCGLRGEHGRWEQLIVLRPRWLVQDKKTQKGSADRRREVLEVARLTIDLDSPTAHDLEVLRELVWSSADDADGGASAHERIDRAFDTERVTKRFFQRLRTHYDRIVEAVETACDDPIVKEGVEAAGGPERVGLRLVTQTLFVYFVQRKGLLEGDYHWMTSQCQNAVKQGEPVHATVFEPLFYEALAKPHDQRPDPWDRLDIPFLNGGLFERRYGDIRLPLPDEVLDHHNGLVWFLDRWTFTVTEETPGEPEVAVDPHMLGKVFESLVSDQEKERHGVVYTPRPVVRFMCREALVPYLRKRLNIGEDFARTLLTDDDADDDVVDIHGPQGAQAFFERLDEAAAAVTILDPAVGSGAFLLGMLTEILRLRSMAHPYRTGVDPDTATQHTWKVEAVGRSLFGVDIQPDAVEICMLRLWLSLVVDTTGTPDPLPNLDYRIVCADSLTDYANGVPVQNTRSDSQTDRQGDLSEITADLDRLTALRNEYFDQADPHRKQTLREELRDEEERVVADLLNRAKGHVTDKHDRDELDRLAEQFASPHRRLPVFMPGFTNPDVWEAGGWDLVLLNPPYLSRKNLPQEIKGDLEKHYNRTMDLLAHFGLRAFDYARDGGAVALIGNDSWFTSTDATDLRRHLFDTDRRRVTTLARTRCFEKSEVAVNGGIFVAEKTPARSEDGVRWVENHGRNPEEMLGASMPAAPRRDHYPIEGSELWVVPLGVYRRLPHRPAFRPSPEARELLGRYEDCAHWHTEFATLYDGRERGRHGWGLLVQTGNLTRRHDEYRRQGFYDQLEPGQFILAGLAVEGGQGLATADDRHFLAVLDGTPEADEARTRQADYLERAAAKPRPAARMHELRRQGADDGQVLVTLNAEFDSGDLGWPKTGLIRIADPECVYQEELSEEIKEDGLEGPVHWVPFEKGDRSDEGAGARWVRKNPIVIDWSTEAVKVLRQRAQHGPRKPYFRNERAWGRAGIAWNTVASYLRARRTPAGAIFGHTAPTVVPLKACGWLSANVLLTLLNASVVDFCLRTFVGSRMHIEVGDLRAIPLPVLDETTSRELDELAEQAVAAKLARDDADEGETRAEAAGRLQEIERRIDERVLALYGLDTDADLWVVR